MVVGWRAAVGELSRQASKWPLPEPRCVPVDRVAGPRRNPMSLEYHRQAFVSALNHDEIVVMARGLGMWSLLVKFVKLYASRDTLVFVLSPQRDFEKLKSALIMEEVGEDMMPAVITTAVSAAERQRAYERRGVVCITERILLGDLLRGKLPAESVGGVILTRAERVRELSPPAFVLRLLRDRAPRTTFVKAFTEDAESMASGFGTIEKAMNTLQVSRVSLWPRFHVTVGSSLDVDPPVDAVELTQPLTPHMRAMHDAVLLILEENLKDLQGRTRLDPSSLSLRNGMLHSFDSSAPEKAAPHSAWASAHPPSIPLLPSAEAAAGPAVASAERGDAAAGGRPQGPSLHAQRNADSRLRHLLPVPRHHSTPRAVRGDSASRAPPAPLPCADPLDAARAQLAALQEHVAAVRARRHTLSASQGPCV